MRIEPFEMERWQSLHEHQVEINLSDSGVHPLSLRELVTDTDELHAFLDARLIYTQTDGTPELRRRIADLYPGAEPTNIEVVNGGAEANFVSVWTCVEPGDEVVCMQPNYQQIAGLVRGLGATTVPWPLLADLDAGRWRLDLERLAECTNEKTRLIVVCNPNNPTGLCLDEGELDAICRIAAAHGAWVLVDEIYRGSELAGAETPSVWGRYERVIVTSSLSKTYGLPGLRLGWIAASQEFIADCWAHHDYTSIGPGALSDRAAEIALRPDVRARLLARTRDHLGRNYATLERWLAANTDVVRYVPPQAGAMLWFTYDAPIGSTELAQRLLEEESLLLVPGDQYGLDHWLRIGFGGTNDELERGLVRVARALATLRPSTSSGTSPRTSC